MAQYDHTTYLNIGKHEREVLIEYDVIPGRAATGPTYDCGGEPADPPEIIIRKVTIQRIKPVAFGRPAEISWELAPEWLIEIIENSDEITGDLLNNAEG